MYTRQKTTMIWLSEKLQGIFEKLRFQVSVQIDQTASDIKELMIYFSTQVDHTPFNCFICCILTHGKLGKVYGTDGATVDIMELTSSFKGAKCKSLVGKPKLFFIQACQGLEKQTGVILFWNHTISTKCHSLLIFYFGLFNMCLGISNMSSYVITIYCLFPSDHSLFTKVYGMCVI